MGGGGGGGGDGGDVWKGEEREAEPGRQKSESVTAEIARKKLVSRAARGLEGGNLLIV